MKITIDKVYMLHKEGTKFYQVLRVMLATSGEFPFPGSSKKAVTFTHWGKQVGEPRPVAIQSRGEMIYVAADDYESKIKAKKTRGYQSKIEWGDTRVLTEPAHLHTYLVAEVGGSSATLAMKELGLAEGTPKTETEDTAARKAASDAKAPHVPEISVPVGTEGWGEF